MKAPFFMIAILAISIVLSACSAASTPVTLTVKDVGTTITLQKGQKLEIKLEGNPTTGFNWYAYPELTSLLTQVGEPEFKADSKLIGSGGMITLRFEAAAAGQGKLQLAYRRAWEKDITPLQTFEVNIVVK